VTTLRLIVDTGFVGGQHEDYIEIPDEEWAEMTQAERDQLGYEAAETLRDNHVEAYYEEIE
jgi:hypothetical protein